MPPDRVVIRKGVADGLRVLAHLGDVAAHQDPDELSELRTFLL
jgi:hypothetical protein